MLFIDELHEELPWLAALRQKLTGLAEQGRCPSGLLLHGPEGVGRRHLALWLATAVLGEFPVRLQPGGEDDSNAWIHPDFMAIEPLQNEDRSGRLRQKHIIGVDQARELIDFLTLTRHGRNGRVAIIYPAEAMSMAAANSLLKTLEEPPAGTVIILIAQGLRQLPATVISRCQRIQLVPPGTAESLAWLEHQLSGERTQKQLTDLLDFSGGAPVRALQLAQSGFPEFARQFLSGLRAIEQRGISPLQVAATCQEKNQPELALQLLEWHLNKYVRDIHLDGDASRCGAQLAAAYDQLSRIRELRRVIKGGINAELSLAELLFDWYGGLGHRGDSNHGQTRLAHINNQG